jgi:hypothetical protein
MSGTEFAAGKLKLLQLTLSYLLQSVNFQLVYIVTSDPLTFLYVFGSPVWEWPAATSSIQLHLCNVFISFPLQVIFSIDNRKKLHGVRYGKAGREPLGCCA